MLLNDAALSPVIENGRDRQAPAADVLHRHRLSCRCGAEDDAWCEGQRCRVRVRSWQCDRLIGEPKLVDVAERVDAIGRCPTGVVDDDPREGERRRRSEGDVIVGQRTREDCRIAVDLTAATQLAATVGGVTTSRTITS